MIDLNSQDVAASGFVKMAQNWTADYTEQQRKRYMLMAFMHAQSAAVISDAPYWWAFKNACRAVLEALLDGVTPYDAIKQFDDYMNHDPWSKLSAPTPGGAEGE